MKEPTERMRRKTSNKLNLLPVQQQILLDLQTMAEVPHKIFASKSIKLPGLNVSSLGRTAAIR
jgi:hypothetical protein